MLTMSEETWFDSEETGAAEGLGRGGMKRKEARGWCQAGSRQGQEGQEVGKMRADIRKSWVIDNQYEWTSNPDKLSALHGDDDEPGGRKQEEENTKQVHRQDRKWTKCERIYQKTLKNRLSILLNDEINTISEIMKWSCCLSEETEELKVKVDFIGTESAKVGKSKENWLMKINRSIIISEGRSAQTSSWMV